MVKSIIASFFLTTLVGCLNIVVPGQQLWNGIKPLTTTRVEVERILGSPVSKNCSDCQYRRGEITVTVYYAVGRCKGKYSGWNVASGTVLSLLVTEKDGPKLSELRPDREKFLRITSDTSLRSYVDQSNGIVYYVDNLAESVSSVQFLPREQDNQLRCKGFQNFNPFGSMISPSMITTDTDLLKLKAFVNVNYFQLMTASGNERVPYRMYVMMYKGANVSGKATSAVGEDLKSFAFKELKASPEKVRFIDGGNRKVFTIEVFIVASDAPPPVSSPL